MTEPAQVGKRPKTGARNRAAFKALAEQPALLDKLASAQRDLQESQATNSKLIVGMAAYKKTADEQHQQIKRLEAELTQTQCRQSALERQVVELSLESLWEFLARRYF